MKHKNHISKKDFCIKNNIDFKTYNKIMINKKLLINFEYAWSLKNGKCYALIPSPYYSYSNNNIVIKSKNGTWNNGKATFYWLENYLNKVFNINQSK
jgi:hypothetical protein